jgi:hypothetical protein
LHYILVRAAFVSIRIEGRSLFSWIGGISNRGIPIRFWKLETRGGMLEDEHRSGPSEETSSSQLEKEAPQRKLGAVESPSASPDEYCPSM